MLFLKLYFHLLSFIKILFYKFIYLGNFRSNGNLTFRKGFSLIIENKGLVQIGKDCFFNNYCSIASRKSITIGDGTIFGEGVKVYDHNHCYSDINIPLKSQGYKSSAIVIGKHCWISSNVIILKGVKIGDNSVIGAGCIIHKDVPANTIVLNQQVLVSSQI